MQSIELLSPAKNVETGIEAIRHGADAVYIGGPSFGARAAAGNSVEDIKLLCEYAHLFGAKVYVTINTILYDEELADVEDLIKQLDEIGVDALITQDLALLTMDIPPIALHASTQMDNCTPSRAQFLERAGYSQIVMARELSLDQISAIHNTTALPLEGFVHGALCVSYSGRCYASEYCFGRSANRGRCAQFCRLAFDLVDADGKVLENDKHLLSLRDMNRSHSLEEMMDAGVSSFKIEGRLKDVAYVKNVTAYYRKAMDEVIQHRSHDYVRASLGIQQYTFTPDLARSFNRGFTDYLLHDRTRNLWNFMTPKSKGVLVGKVSRVGRRSFIYNKESEYDLHNGDGLTYFDNDGRLQGFRVNRVEGNEVFPLKMPELSSGTLLYRNEDHEWEALLAKPSAERRLPVSFVLSELSDGFRLTASAPVAPRFSEGRVETSLDFPMAIQSAEKPQVENIRRNLSKLGDTSFIIDEVAIETNGERFIPASVLSDMRRKVTMAMEKVLQEFYKNHRDRRRAETLQTFTGQRFSYISNIANAKARNWLLARGAEDVSPAFEIRQPREAQLMTCRHCLRYAFGQCPKETSHRPTWNEPLFLRLPDGRQFSLYFDCKNCEMQVLKPE